MPNTALVPYHSPPGSARATGCRAALLSPDNYATAALDGLRAAGDRAAQWDE